MAKKQTKQTKKVSVVNPDSKPTEQGKGFKIAFSKFGRR